MLCLIVLRAGIDEEVEKIITNVHENSQTHSLTHKEGDEDEKVSYILFPVNSIMCTTLTQLIFSLICRIFPVVIAIKTRPLT